VGHVRLFLMVASAVAMTTTFRLWIPLIGMAAPLAAVLFSFSWLGLLNGSEVMPNLWAAILALATAGLIARRIEGGTMRHAVAASAVLGVMALVRPTEAAVVAGAIGLYVVVFRTRYWRLLFALGLGLALGWLPWFVEMSIRFDGPVKALRAAAVAGHVMNTSVAHNLLHHLAGTDGRLSASSVHWGGAIWWSVLVVLAIVAIARGTRPTDRAVAILASLGALALAMEYLVFVSWTSPRFLLPAYGFASLAAAIGLVSLLRDKFVSRAFAVVVLLLVIPWAIWQGAVVDRFQGQRMRSTLAFRDIGLTLRRLADGRPCSFLSPHGYPSIEFAAGCDGAELPQSRGLSATELEELRTSGKLIFVIRKKTAPRASALGSLTPLQVPGPAKIWFIYQISGST
jgi:hypothetical protein